MDIDTAPPTPAPSEESVVHPPVDDRTPSPKPQVRPACHTGVGRVRMGKDKNGEENMMKNYDA